MHVGLHLILDQDNYQIIRITEENVCYLERKKDLAIISRTKQQLLSLLSKGDVTLQVKGHHAVKPSKQQLDVDIATLAKEHQSFILRRYEYVKEAERKLLNPCRKGLEEIISKVARKTGDQTPPSVITVYRWWKRWQGAHYDLKALGRFQSFNSHRKFKDDFKAIFNEVVNDVYLCREKNSKSDTYISLIHRIKQYNHNTIQPINIPSQATVYRMLDKLDDYEVRTARYGRKNADYYFRSVGRGVTTKHILERVEVDHTPLDIMVVNEETGIVEGRPYLTCLLDVKSRMPLGVEIDFEPPSVLSVMKALKQAIWFKDWVNETYPTIKNHWPAYGIPNTLICDNGLEFHSEQLHRVCAELNVELVYCPKQQAHYKGCVERFFGTLNRQVCHKLKGTTFSNIRQRGDYQSVKEACVTLKELKANIYQWLIDVYCQSLHKFLQNSPFNEWQQGIKHIEPLLTESLQSLDLILSHQYRRKINHQGIQFANLCYNSKELRLIRINNGDIKEVLIRVDFDNLGFIWAHDTYNNEYIAIPCINQEYARDLSFRQHKAILDNYKEQGKKNLNEDSLLTAKVNLLEQIKKTNSKSIREQTKVARLKKQQLEKACQLIQLLDYKKALDMDLDLSDIPDFDVINPYRKQEQNNG